MFQVARNRSEPEGNILLALAFTALMVLTSDVADWLDDQRLTKVGGIPFR